MSGPTRVLRLITRLNIGGPAMQAITLTDGLNRHGFTTLLATGIEGEHEGNMNGLADRLGVTPVEIPSLRREISVGGDARALWAVRRMIREFRPHILDTHTAKAGTVGRLAAILAGSRRPQLVIHTFHGHVLAGYFSKRAEWVFTTIERFLAKRTDVLIAVSDEVRDELVDLGIAGRDQIRVVHLGFDLAPFVIEPAARRTTRDVMRRRLGVGADAPLVTLVARLVPIKRVDVFLAAAEQLAATHPHVRFCVAGDGELGHELRTSERAQRLGVRVAWPGFVEDMPALLAASDVVALTSDNEGTPVSLIEALAAGTPVVGTRVGGVPSVVRDGKTGLLAPPGDAPAIAGAMARLLDQPGLAAEMSAAGREDVLSRFSLDRLVSDVVKVYQLGVQPPIPDLAASTDV